MTGMILKVSFRDYLEKGPEVTSMSQCFFITRNIIACAYQEINANNMLPKKPHKHCEFFILINGESIKFSKDDIYEYPESNITFIVLKKSYDIEPIVMSKKYKHRGEKIYNESLDNPLINMELIFAWEDRKLIVVSQNLDKFYCTFHGMGGENDDITFLEPKAIEAKNNRDRVLVDENGKLINLEEYDYSGTVIILQLHFEEKAKRETGSPVFSAKTKEFIGMIIYNGIEPIDGREEFIAVTSFEFIKLMKHLGIIKKPWYRRKG
jgi:hypothetical protein